MSSSGFEGNTNGSRVEERQEVVENEVDFPTPCENTSGVQEVSKAEIEVKLIKTRNFICVDSYDAKEKQYKVETEVDGGEEQCLHIVSESGNECVGQQEIAGKNEKCLKRNVQGKDSEKDNGSKRCYSRNAMESLRFLSVEEQLRMWNEVYIGMGPGVAHEYGNMADTKPHKQSSKSFDNRQRSSKRKEKDPYLSKTKKKDNGCTFGEVCYQNMEHSFIENVVGEDCSWKSDNFREEKSLDFSCAGCANDEAADYNIVENECNESIGSGSEDEFDNIQKPAFLVEGDPDFESGPPQDGLEYLRRVRWEAAQIPKVKVAKLDEIKLKSEQTVYMPMIPDIAKCPEHLLPSKHWEDAFLADFSELRLALTRLDSVSLPESNFLKKHFNINEDDSSSSSSDPLLSTVLCMDAVSRASMLRNRIRSLEATDTLSRNNCAWLYAQCAVVDTPLDADTGASLRCLLRKCAKLRSEKSECDDEVAMLNILVIVSGKYFGQSEN